VLHFSVQHDHVHLLVEADGHTGLRRGIQGLAIRIAKGINRALHRHGRIWADRYHSRTLNTPREVRHALVYVLQNWRKHLSGVRGSRPTIVRSVVHGLACADKSSSRTRTDRYAANLARIGRLAAPWTPPFR
jgi:hypothetical protein